MKKVIIIIVIIAILFAVYWFFFRMTKDKAIKTIVESGANPNTGGVLNSFGDSYLIAWAKALKSGNATFSDSNKNYSVLGGKAV